MKKYICILEVYIYDNKMPKEDNIQEEKQTKTKQERKESTTGDRHKQLPHTMTHAAPL